MNLQSLEELEQRAIELTERHSGNDPDMDRRLIGIYKIMLRKMTSRDPRREPLKEKVVDYLVRYGAYMKSAEEKNSYSAEDALKDVLRFDHSNPIAVYRLGFLAYRKRQYAEAFVHFDNALKYQERYTDVRYRLTEQQEKNAYLYLTNSSLHVAAGTYEKMNERFPDLPEKLSAYEFSELYDYLGANEDYLESRAFVRESETGIAYCSKEACRELVDSDPEDTIVLYFNDRTITLYFNGNVDGLTKQNGDILRHLLTNSTEQRPATRRGAVTAFFGDGDDEEINRNTYTVAVGRLVAKMRGLGIPDVVHAVNREMYQGPAYYFDGSLPFVILYRADSEFL